MGEAPVRGKRLSRANRAIDRTDDELAAIAGRARIALGNRGKPTTGGRSASAAPQSHFHLATAVINPRVSFKDARHCARGLRRAIASGMP